MSKIVNNGTIEKQVNIEEVQELHIHENETVYVNDFTDVESVIEQFPNNLTELFKLYGDIVKSNLSISDILNNHKDELILPDMESERKLDLLWESWFLFLIYLTINNGGDFPIIGDYKIQTDEDPLKVKHIFYLGNKNFEGLVSEFLRNENTLDRIKYDLYIFNNKTGLYPSILPAKSKEKILSNIGAVKSLSDELIGVKKSGFLSIRKIHDLLSELIEEDITLLRDDVMKQIQGVCKNAVS